MAKDKTHRYASASELAADIGRYLRHEPVQAGPPGVTYRLNKFIRRHRAGVVAGILVVAALIAGITGAMMGLVRARKAESIAQKEAAKASAINNFLLETLGSANPVEGKSREVTVLEALKSATDKIDQAFPNQPVVEGEVRSIIGVTYLRLGRYEEAEKLLRTALKMLEGTLGREDPDIAATLDSLGILRQERGDFKEAESLQGRALAILRKKYGDQNQDVLSIQSNLALLYQDMGEYEEAAKLMRQTLASDRKMLGNEHPNVASDLANLGNLLLKSGNYTESEPLLREAESIFKKNDHPWVCLIRGNIGELLTKKGDASAAEPVLADALAMGLKIFGDQNQDVAKVRSKYGTCLIQLKKYDLAEEQLLKALPVLQNSLGEHNLATQTVISRLAELYEVWGKAEEASKYRALLSSREK
jgi:tetratricopeptide (TPR) repeat protein